MESQLSQILDLARPVTRQLLKKHTHWGNSIFGYASKSQNKKCFKSCFVELDVDSELSKQCLHDAVVNLVSSSVLMGIAISKMPILYSHFFSKKRPRSSSSTTTNNLVSECWSYLCLLAYSVYQANFQNSAEILLVLTVNALVLSQRRVPRKWKRNWKRYTVLLLVLGAAVGFVLIKLVRPIVRAQLKRSWWIFELLGYLASPLLLTQYWYKLSKAKKKLQITKRKAARIWRNVSQVSWMQLVPTILALLNVSNPRSRSPYIVYSICSLLVNLLDLGDKQKTK